MIAAIEWHDIDRAVTSEVFLGAVIGAFASGLVGLATQWLHHRLETRARRTALLQALREQLEALPESGDAIVANVKIRSIRPLTATGPLLSSGVLDATKDAKLLGELVSLEDWAAQYNAVVIYRNQLWAQGGQMAQAAHTWDSVAVDLYIDLHTSAERTLKLIGPIPTSQQSSSS